MEWSRGKYQRNFSKTKFSMHTNSILPSRPCDFSFTIKENDIGWHTVEAATETVLARSEYETETPRERFMVVQVTSKHYSEYYIVNLWMLDR